VAGREAGETRVVLLDQRLGGRGRPRSKVVCCAEKQRVQILRKAA